MSICHHYEKLSRKHLNSVPSAVLPDTVAQIRSAFDFFDLNGNGTIELDEFRRILQALNIKKSLEESQNVFDPFDLNGDGKIDFPEFTFALARSVKNDVLNLEQIRDRFNQFVDDQDGKLLPNNLPNLIRKAFRIKVVDEEIFELLAKFEIFDEKTKISFERFVRMIQYVVRQTEQFQTPDYMKKLRHRCGAALRNLNSQDLKLLRKRTGN